MIIRLTDPNRKTNVIFRLCNGNFIRDVSRLRWMRAVPVLTGFHDKCMLLFCSQRDGRRTIRRYRGEGILQRSGRVPLHPADPGERKSLPHKRRGTQGFKSESRFFPLRNLSVIYRFFSLSSPRRIYL